MVEVGNVVGRIGELEPSLKRDQQLEARLGGNYYTVSIVETTEHASVVIIQGRVGKDYRPLAMATGFVSN